MSDKKITLDYAEYISMTNQIKELQKDKDIYMMSLDWGTWSYKAMLKPECIEDFISKTTVKEFKRLKTQ